MSSLSKSEAWQFHAHGLDPGFQDVICMSYVCHMISMAD
jgi:hypothetical protein